MCFGGGPLRYCPLPLPFVTMQLDTYDQYNACEGVMTRKQILQSVLLTLLLPTAFGWCEQTNVREFISKMEQKYHFDQKALCETFDRYPRNESVIRKIKKPFESVSWDRYRNMFITEKRLASGQDFWQKHQKSLLKAEKRFDVDPSVILAILAMESDYGRQTMPYKSIDALLTLSFAYPPRAQFFSSELESLLLLAKENNLDIHDIGGSYAGAIGMPQFMPSNYRSLAVATDKHHKPDLTHNVDDAIMSIAHYMHHHGWKHYEPAITPGLPGPNSLILDPDHPEKAWKKHPNFAAIMRYNKSPLYASAVALLAQGIEQRIAYANAR